LSSFRRRKFPRDGSQEPCSLDRLDSREPKWSLCRGQAAILKYQINVQRKDNENGMIGREIGEILAEREESKGV
jgi:hypothetical protein